MAGGKKKSSDKGPVDKKSSVFKVYDFDASEDEPYGSRVMEKKRLIGGRGGIHPPQDPIAVQFSNKPPHKQLLNVSQQQHHQPINHHGELQSLVTMTTETLSGYHDY